MIGNEIVVAAAAFPATVKGSNALGFAGSDDVFGTRT